MKDKQNKAIIVIPAYKSNISEIESVSLRRCLLVLRNYDICFVSPHGLNMDVYRSILADYQICFNVMSFPSHFFDSVKSYNRLMLTHDFYLRFCEYEYMLIYQLDAYVFDDQLAYWCNKGYDYIGAPWFQSNGKLCSICGNGGFSLRKIESFLSIPSDNRLYSIRGLVCLYWNKKPVDRIISSLKGFSKKYNSFDLFIQENELPEDWLYAAMKYRIKDPFIIPSPREAMRFAFEVNPDLLFEMNNGLLPFGCHAFMKYNYNSFWKRFIQI